MLYDQLLPINHKYFKESNLSVVSTIYDTTWINPKYVDPVENAKPIKLSLEDIEVINYKICLISQIPNYDSTIVYNDNEPFIHFFYLQLSQIVFNEDKNKGLFYYGVMNKERISSNFDYQYIIKENNRWRLIKE